MTSAAKKVAATNTRNFRTFLLMQQFEAREIGMRIAQARNERGLSQEELAEMSSFSKRSLQDYEAGVTIPYRHFRELGRLLRRPEEWFLYGDQEPTVAEVDGDAERWRILDRRLLRMEEALGLVPGDPLVPPIRRAANGD